MSIYRNFQDYKEEIELIYIQNSGVECELYSIIATLIRASKPGSNISLRDVSTRRTTNKSKRFKSAAGFPDFVVLRRAQSQDACIYGCIEAKTFVGDLDSERNKKQLNGHIKLYDKVIYTNGLTWRLYEDKSYEPKKEVVLGKYNKGKFTWKENSEWHELLEMLDTINWELKCNKAK